MPVFHWQPFLITVIRSLNGAEIFKLVIGNGTEFIGKKSLHKMFACNGLIEFDRISHHSTTRIHRAVSYKTGFKQAA